MAPKSAASSSASGLLADALNTFSKAANQALVTVEEKAKAELVRANAEVGDARRERDEALQATHACELKIKEWERRAEGWKMSIEKSELTIQHQTETIQHQAETIAQLREESQQWKNQLLRFEDASRREIQDWKDQYQRAEVERLRLSARLDELIAEQLQRSSQIPTTSYAPIPIPTPAPLSPAAKRTRTIKNTPKAKAAPAAHNSADSEGTYVEGPTPTPSRSRPQQSQRARADAAATPKTPARARAQSQAQASGSQTQPSTLARQTLIRRVHAVVEVPVKEEEASDDDSLGAGSATQSVDSVYEPPRQRRAAAAQAQGRGQKRRSTGTGGATGTAAKRRSSVKSRPRVESDDDDDDEEEDEEGEANGGNYTERANRDQEDYDGDDYVEEDDDDDDDMLLIGSEKNHSDSYTARRTSGVPTPARPRQSMGQSHATPANKKRKLANDVEAPTRTPKVAKRKQ